MTRRNPLVLVGVLVALVVGLLAFPMLAPRPATAASIDYVSLNNKSELSSATAQAGANATTQLGAHAANGRSATVGMTRLLRGGTVVQAAPDTYRYPMGVTSMAIDAAAATMSPDVANVLAGGQIVLGSTSANLRGAQVGDVVELISAAGNLVQLTIGMIAPDATIGGAEIVVGDAQADALGLTIVTRMVVWGFASRSALEDALNANGLISTTVRVNRSWDIASPDSNLSLSQTKALLGEFPYQITSGDTIHILPSWVAANISGGGVRTPFAGIGIVAACHNTVRPAIQAALSQVAASGLSGAINVSNSNQYGGCFNPRFNRLSGNIGGLSRHAWAMAIDMNTTANPQGGVPQMDCRVVQIFRHYGFAWGGNFLFSDGMHFEYVGQARDQIGYPSRYCPTGAPVPPYGGLPAFPPGLKVANPVRASDPVQRTIPDPNATTVPSSTTVPATTTTAAGAVPGARPAVIESPAIQAAPLAEAVPMSQRSVMFGSDGFSDGD